MKKILILEIVVLVLLLVLSIAICRGLDRKPSVPEETSGVSVEDTQPDSTAPEDTTAPEVTDEAVEAWMTFPQDRELTAQQYFVYSKGTYLAASHGEDQRVYPASITKLFTAYMGLQYLSSDTLVTAGNELDQVVWGSSVADIQKGDVLSVAQLVEAMLLPSGNDAAYVLATAAGRQIAGDPDLDAAMAVKTFMTMMNSQAKARGMTGTNFVNPDGIHDEQHYMSFHDVVLMGQLVLREPTIMRYAGLAVGNNPRYEEDNQAEDASKQWKNTNALIQPESEYYCPYTVGLKTGQTPMAGSCLLSAFEYDGKDYIIGVFGCPEVEDRFEDTLQLFNQAIGY